MLQILSYQPAFRTHFQRLNEEWLRHYFQVEPVDQVMFDDPEGTILQKNGLIYFALWGDEVVGTASLLHIENGQGELAKMAVEPAFQGKGIGKALVEHCLMEAKRMGLTTVYLFTNSKLTIAVEMYRRLGFQETPVGASEYSRTNMRMERYVGNSALYESTDRVEDAFEEDRLPEEQQQAQWAELVWLKQAIFDIYQQKGAPVDILDIGVGSARILRRLHAIPEVWAQIGSYDGMDNAQACVDISAKAVEEMNISDKVKVRYADIHLLDSWDHPYDIIMTTWFTGGNFYPMDFPFDTYSPEKERYDLSFNPAFDRVFSTAWQRLRPGGAIILGSCYVDSDATRRRQEAFYRHLKMSVITDEKDTFTATKERFWSQRFTPERLRRYFHFAPAENVQIIPLDTYRFAIQVRVNKGQI